MRSQLVIIEWPITTEDPREFKVEDDGWIGEKESSSGGYHGNESPEVPLTYVD